MKTNWLLLLMTLLLGGTAGLAYAHGIRLEETARASSPAQAEQEDAEAPGEATQEPDEDWSALSEEEALEKVAELDKQFNEQLAEFRKAFQAAAPEDRAKLRSQMPQPEALISKYQKLADLFPKTGVAAKSLLWIVQHQRSGIDYDHALATLLEQHTDLPELKPVVAMMQYQTPSAQVTLNFENLIANGANRELAGVAQYAYLQYQKRTEQMKKMLSENPERAQAMENAYGKEGIEYVLSFEGPSDAERLELLEKLAADFGDVEVSNGRTLAEVVEGEIFEAKYLQIGMVAPDIDGEDIEGTGFKLSDYRGKVVMLDFWGDW